MLRFTALLTGLFISGAAAQASCFNYEESGGPAPTALMCIEGRCGETAATFECANASGGQFGFDNGLSVDCIAQGGVSACAISLEGRRVLEQAVTCTSLTDEAVCGSLPTPCDAQMGAIRAGFEAAPEYSRMGAQSVLQSMSYYMNFDTIPAQPAQIDGSWGARTEAAFRRFCANDLHRIGTQNPGRLTEQEAYNLTGSFNDLLEVMGDQAEYSPVDQEEVNEDRAEVEFAATSGLAVPVCAARPAELRGHPAHVVSFAFRVDPQDRMNSSGAALSSALGIIQQDRANMHRFGNPGLLDQYDSVYADSAIRMSISNSELRVDCYSSVAETERNLLEWTGETLWIAEVLLVSGRNVIYLSVLAG